MISVVVPVYGNATTLVALHARICAAAELLRSDLEIVYVDDASPDDCPRVLDAIADSDRRARVMHLAQNVGQHRAILSGFREARGDSVVVLDADLQDPPEAIPVLIDHLESGYDVVFAGRQGRYHGSAIRRVTSRLFKRAQAWLLGLPLDAGSYVGLRRPIIERVLGMPAGRQTVVAMIGVAGGRMTSVPIERARRPSGRSAFSFRMRAGLAWSTLVWAARMRLTGRGR